ncbi:Ubiquitin and WLM domain-containing metalloprotease [Erysiphe neolycopersici]|uniref:Ubiquitin and WLM domain-containing metalloprotease n=1 Tax=Erysiphe neolycopersici TaxID=212602 RepID=A0A420I6U2_9PEZI|nr:Ubiquitin and WLM domain-containing metalloprotease [Erysiphe neolycopersici]
MTILDDDSSISVNLIYHGKPSTFSFPSNASISDLSDKIAETLHVPSSNQKLLISKIGLLKPPFKDPELPLSSILTQKVTLMGSTIEELSSISIASEEAARRVYRREQPLQKVTASKTHDRKKEQEEKKYTFIKLQPLSYLPNPSRSLQFLQRLKDDAGIKSVMRKHKFTVPLLTEMDPTEYTQSNHEGTSRTLGLNRNQGEIIELRLRTDAYDGYRDYKTIRRTLCHELTHNVYGPHNRDFWDLCKQIEKEVETADWRSGGRAVGGSDTYEPINGVDEINERGGWTGGEYVLGVDPAKRKISLPSDQGSSRREIMAKAAEQRINRTEKRTNNGYDGSSKNL